MKEKTSKASREFYIPRLNREKSLYGTEFEVKLRNELTQKVIAKKCSNWISRKAVFRSNVTQEQMMSFKTVDESTYMPINGFTTVDLGCERGNEWGSEEAEERIGGILMSVEQYQRSVNSLDKEIILLEKKKAGIDKECARLQSKIASVEKRIKSTSAISTVKSKLRQIEGWTKDYNKKYENSADLGKKISDKRTKRNDAYLRLQKEQGKEMRKQNEAIKRMQDSYEQRINELSRSNLPKSVLTKEQSEIGITEEYDVFVSHAWEDKESFADEFVKALRDKGIRVWYDTSQIKWGDSMRERIDEGLKKSKFGIAILSPNYIAEGKYWTKAELDGLFQLDSVNGKPLLPIWHDLTKKQVVEFSPIIANRKAMTTATMTAMEIVEELVNLLPNEESED